MLHIDRLKVRMLAISWMLVGTAFVLSLMLIMNGFSDEIEKDDRLRTTEFKVQQANKPKPPKQVKKPKPKQAKKLTAPKLELNSNIAGLDLGLPAFALGELGDVDDLVGDTSDVVLNSDQVDQPPRAIARTQVEYPRRARAKEIEGYVVVSLLINKSGKVTTARVIEAEPAGVFEEKALQTVRGWIFEPARFKGQAVESWANQTIRFELG